jgi:hypothetical protein
MARKAKKKMKLELAIALLFAARKFRIVNPEGEFDSGGRWHPSDSENADFFTAGIRSPSRTWPFSYMLAARTRKHIKALADVSPEFVLEAAAVAARKRGGPDFQAARDAFVAAPNDPIIAAAPAPAANVGNEPVAAAA